MVLIVELIGLSAVIPYGMLLPLHTASAGSRGLPLDDGRVVLPPEKRFRVHILVPCYKVGGWVLVEMNIVWVCVGVWCALEGASAVTRARFNNMSLPWHQSWTHAPPCALTKLSTLTTNTPNPCNTRSPWR